MFKRCKQSVMLSIVWELWKPAIPARYAVNRRLRRFETAVWLLAAQAFDSSSGDGSACLRPVVWRHSFGVPGSGERGHHWCVVAWQPGSFPSSLEWPLSTGSAGSERLLPLKPCGTWRQRRRLECQGGFRNRHPGRLTSVGFASCLPPTPAPWQPRGEDRPSQTRTTFCTPNVEPELQDTKQRQRVERLEETGGT